MVADWRTAPISEELRATLAFLAKLTREPEAVGAADARAALDTGVSPEALRDAIGVCAAFNTINRIVDALGIERLPSGQERRGASFTVLGYA